MIKIFLYVFLIYIWIVQTLSRNWYKFCKCKNECRNATCRKARECPYNTFYTKD